MGGGLLWVVDCCGGGRAAIGQLGGLGAMGVKIVVVAWLLGCLVARLLGLLGWSVLLDWVDVERARYHGKNDNKISCSECLVLVDRCLPSFLCTSPPLPHIPACPLFLHVRDNFRQNFEPKVAFRFGRKFQIDPSSTLEVDCHTGRLVGYIRGQL